MKKFLLTFLLSCIFYFSSFANENVSYINQDSNENSYIENINEINNILNDFYVKNNIIPYVYIAKNSNQEVLDKTINKYKKENENKNFILLFISIDNKNIAIYNPTYLDFFMQQNDKYLILNSLQSSFVSNNIDETVITCYQNIDKLMEFKDIKLEKELIEPSNKLNLKSCILLLFMIISSISLVLNSIYFIKKNKP